MAAPPMRERALEDARGVANRRSSHAKVSSSVRCGVRSHVGAAGGAGVADAPGLSSARV